MDHLLLGLFRETEIWFLQLILCSPDSVLAGLSGVLPFYVGTNGRFPLVYSRLNILVSSIIYRAPDCDQMVAFCEHLGVCD